MWRSPMPPALRKRSIDISLRGACGSSALERRNGGLTSPANVAEEVSAGLFGSGSGFALEVLVALGPVAAALLDPLQVAVAAIRLVGLILLAAGVTALLPRFFGR